MACAALPTSTFLLSANAAPRLPRSSASAASASVADASPVRSLKAQASSPFRATPILRRRGRRALASVEGSVTVEEPAVSSEEPEASPAVEAEAADGSAPAKKFQRSASLQKQAKREITVSREQLVPGAVFTGKVRAVQSYGAFVDIGAFTDGLVHISQLASGFVKEVGDVVAPGQEVSVTVVELDEQAGRIRLTMRDKESEAAEQASRSGSESGGAPGESGAKPLNRGKIAGRGSGNARANSRSGDDRKATKLKKGQELKGTVKNIIRNGAFIEFAEEGEEGFLRGSEITEGGENVAVDTLLTVGQEVSVRVLKIERGKAALTMKAQVDMTSINDSLNTNVGAGGASNPFATFFRSANLVPAAAASADAREAPEAEGAAQTGEAPAATAAAAVEEAAGTKEAPAEQEEAPAAAVEPEARAEEAPVAEEEAPAAAVEPEARADETPVAEEEAPAAAVEPEARAEETPAAEEAPAAAVEPEARAEETPAAEEAPAAPVEPEARAEETPAAEEAPAAAVEPEARAEETPAAEEEPAARAEESSATKAAQSDEPAAESKGEEPRSLSLGEIAEGIGGAVAEVEKVVEAAAEFLGGEAPAAEEAEASSAQSGAGAAAEAEKVSAGVAGAGAGAAEVAKGAGGASGPTAAQVKELREKSGAGMMECKKALVACGNDVGKAGEYLRKKGLASADKKSSRIAAEGRVGSYVHDGRMGVLIEVNCETDFVSRGAQFKELVADMGMQVVACPDVRYVSVEDVPAEFVAKEREIESGKEDLASKPPQIRERIVDGRIAKRVAELALLEQAYIRDDKILVKNLVKQTTAKLGEKVQIRRFVRFNLGEGIEKKSVDFAAEVAAQTAAKADAKPAAEAPKEEAKTEEAPKVAVSAASVKELREATGAGMMECKKALAANENDVQKATDYLRKKGLASADKKSGRIASEGLIGSYIHDGRIGVLVEVNSETDFVARSAQFKELVANIGMQVAACPQVQFVSVEEIPGGFVEKEREIEMGKEDLGKRPEAVRAKIVEGRVAKTLNELALLEQAYIRDDKISVKEYVKRTIAALGENIQVRRFARFNLGEGIEKRSTDFAAEVAAQTGARA